MNKKVLGWLLIIFGGYFVIGNTIFSILFNRAPYSGGGPIGDPIPISPWNYILNWLSFYGAITILVALAGIVLFLLGLDIIEKNKKEIKNHI